MSGKSEDDGPKRPLPEPEISTRQMRDKKMKLDTGLSQGAPFFTMGTPNSLIAAICKRFPWIYLYPHSTICTEKSDNNPESAWFSCDPHTKWMFDNGCIDRDALRLVALQSPLEGKFYYSLILRKAGLTLLEYERDPLMVIELDEKFPGRPHE